MSLLKISTAGVRGVVGDGLSVELALRFAQAFCTYLEGGQIAVARDSRPSGRMIRSAVLAGALAGGSRVIDLGVVPTPSVQVYLERLAADGAVVIAAGHNPVEWNALKFLRSDGMYLNVQQGEELLELFHHAEFLKAPWDRIQRLEFDEGCTSFHANQIEHTFDIEAIRGRTFKVAVDCCNGPCSQVTPQLLRRLGCEVVTLNDDPDRPFPHSPNPTPQNMAQLEALVKAAGADLGFAHDAEGERLGMVTGDGVALDQESTFAVAAWLGLNSGWIEKGLVTNLSTSRMVEDLAKKHAVPFHRTPIGQAHVAEQAMRQRADFAGEGCGQIILPRIHLGPDGIAAIVFILHHLAQLRLSVAEVVAQLPRYFRIKRNLTLPSNQLFRRLKQFRDRAEKRAGEFDLDSTDGIRLSSDESWLHVRASATESMLRIIAESRHLEGARELSLWAEEQITQ